MTSKTTKLAIAFGFTLIANQAAASGCDMLPDHAALTSALKASTATTSDTVNGGLELNMWASLINRDGAICAVAMTGEHLGDQWGRVRLSAE